MTFTHWLKSQLGRNDAIGDLARFIAADQRVPDEDGRLAHWKEYLEDKHSGPAAFRALDEAWREYSVLH
jgi:hypothetical protein